MFAKFFKITSVKRKDVFKKEDVSRLLECIPSLITVKNKHTDKKFRESLPIALADQLDNMFYFGDETKKLSHKEKRELAEEMLSAFLTITDKEIKFSFLDHILLQLCLFKEWEIQEAFKGADTIRDGTRDLSEEKLKHIEDTFNRRNELPKDDLYRRNFVISYIDEKVYDRFYMQKEKDAGRYGTENEGEDYTPEKGREWDEHFNALCDEYGEPEHKRNFSEEHYRNIECFKNKLWDYSDSFIMGEISTERDILHIARDYGIEDTAKAVIQYRRAYLDRLKAKRKPLFDIIRQGDTPAS